MEIKLLSCPLCLKPHFEGVDSLRSSLISVATSTLTCPVCSEVLLGLDKLTIHLFTHINDEEKNQQINAEIIDKSNEKVVEDNNNTVEEPVNSNSIKCDICYFNFTDKTILEMHQKLLHQTPPDKNTGLYSYHCHLCSKKFKMRGSLMVHLRVAHYGFTHHNNNNNNEIVSTSNNFEEQKLTNELNILENVANKIQDNNKQWECDVCSKLFTTKYFLKKHKRLHTGEMPYYCVQCNKSFTFQQSYHKHMLYHSSEKPYVCNECGRAFKELSTLQNHSRIHSGERPFGCETCGKRFRQRVSYLVHQRIHTGVMPYKCTACEKSFRYKVSQRSHKCPVNPPGSVIRVPETAETKTTAPSLDVARNSKDVNIKCILSVDYNTGNINFIPNSNNNNETISIVCLNEQNTNGDEGIKKGNVKESSENDSLISGEMSLCDTSFTTTHQPDLFTMVLSPLLPEVESLCLTNSPSEVDANNLN